MVPPVPPARFDEFARVVRLIAEMPRRRERPEPGDREGPFDVWFDGGACAHTTDFNRFELADGSSAWLSTSSLGLKGGVLLASGEVVEFEQKRPAVESVEKPREGACVVCGGDIRPGDTFTHTPRGPAHVGCV